MIKTISSSNLTFKKFTFTPTVTVLLSTYNNSKYVVQQVESIINQMDVDVKLVIRDDGSFDNTKEILLDLKQKYLDKIHLEFGNNIGIHKSYHYLFNNFHESKYVSFADGDDIWDSDKLAVAIYLLEKFNVSLYAGSSRLIDNKGNLIKKRRVNRSNFYFKENRFILFPGFQGCTLVIKRTVIDTIIQKTSNPVLPHDNWIPLVAYFTSNLIVDNTDKMSYRQHDQSWTGNRKKLFSFFLKKINYFIRGIKRYKFLAIELIHSFSTQISINDYKILFNLSKSNLFSSRIKLFLNPKFSKDGFIKNLFFKFYLFLFGL
jgi:glycosyltransferase involved in cell wall biosynthesis